VPWADPNPGRANMRAAGRLSWGARGVTNIRTFVDPLNPTHVALLMDVPDIILVEEEVPGRSSVVGEVRRRPHTGAAERRVVADAGLLIGAAGRRRVVGIRCKCGTHVARPAGCSPCGRIARCMWLS